MSIWIGGLSASVLYFLMICSKTSWTSCMEYDPLGNYNYSSHEIHAMPMPTKSLAIYQIKENSIHLYWSNQIRIHFYDLTTFLYNEKVSNII